MPCLLVGVRESRGSERALGILGWCQERSPHSFRHQKNRKGLGSGGVIIINGFSRSGSGGWRGVIHSHRIYKYFSRLKKALVIVFLITLSSCRQF